MAPKLRKISTPQRGLFLLILAAIAFVVSAVPIPSHTASAAGAADVLWSGTQEGGNLNEWGGDGGGGMYNSGSAESVASTEQHRTGSQSMRARIWTPSSTTSGVRAFRWKEARANRDLYYSTYVYLPQNLDPSAGFLNMFQFKSRPADGSRVDPVWAFYGAPDGKGGTYLKAGYGWGGTPLAGPQSSDGVGGKWIEPTQKTSLPVGRWVHLQAFLHQSNGFDGRIQFWQDGVQLFDLNNIRTSFNNCSYNSWCADNEWSVNLYSDKLNVNPATMYIDDSSISRSPVGDAGSPAPTPTTAAPAPTTTAPSTTAPTPPTTTTPTTTPPTPTTAAPAPTTTAPTPPSTTPPTTKPPTTNPPTGAPLLWSAKQDGGTTAEWASNWGGGLYNTGTNQAAVSGEQHRSGTSSLRAKIWPSATGNSGVKAFRWNEARTNRDAYYSTWVYLPQKLSTTGNFLNLFQFVSRSADGSRVDPTWGFYGAPDGKGGSYLKAGWGWGGTPLPGPRSTDGVSGKWFEPAQKVSLPVGKWVHLEAFLHQANGFDGRVQFWQDGVKLFDLNNVRTSFKNCNYNSWCASNEWSVNLFADKVNANPATMYIDDSAIARSYIS
jgi:hypothetical protein